MNNYVKLRRQAIGIAIVAGFWIIISLLISSITFLMTLQEKYPLNTFEIIIHEFLCILPWVICTPVIIWLTRKYPFEKRKNHVSIAVHLLAALFVFAFHSLEQSYVVSIYFDQAFTWAYIKRDFFGFLDMRLMLYTVVVLGVYAIDFQRKNRESSMREPRLRGELNKARYQALLNQIQPGFLLNSIDTIKKKVGSDPEESEQILTDFSDLLRIMLQNAKREEVTIQEDLESFHLYMNLLEKRLGSKIEKKTDIAEECYEALVPSYLMLIPLFEEIIAPESKEKKVIKGINYSARRTHDEMHLEARVEGGKISPEDLTIFLKRARFTDIKQRLQSQYDGNIDFKTKTAGDNIHITLRIPYRVRRAQERAHQEQYTTSNKSNKIVEG